MVFDATCADVGSLKTADTLLFADFSLLSAAGHIKMCSPPRNRAETMTNPVALSLATAAFLSPYKIPPFQHSSLTPPIQSIRRIS